jgi:hypothetical protein
VRAAFDDVYWLTLGRATREQLLAKMRMLVDEVGGGEGAATGTSAAGAELKTVEAATKRLRELLRARRVLVVVDDAWTRDHFAAFVGAIDSGGGGGGGSSNAASASARPRAARCSSRRATWPTSGARPSPRPRARWRRQPGRASATAPPLTRPSSAPSPRAPSCAAAAGIAPAHAAGLDFARVFAAVGTLPLPLFIVGACARRQLEPLGRPDREAERDVVGAIAGALAASDGAASGGGAAGEEPLPAHGAWLESARFRAALLAQNAEAGKYAPTFAAISLALGSLAATDALAFASLGLFPEDTAVHEAVVAAAWRMEAAPRARARAARTPAGGRAREARDRRGHGGRWRGKRVGRDAARPCARLRGRHLRGAGWRRCRVARQLPRAPRAAHPRGRGG